MLESELLWEELGYELELGQNYRPLKVLLHFASSLTALNCINTT